MAFSVNLLIQKAYPLSLLGDNLMERAGYKSCLITIVFYIILSFKLLFFGENTSLSE
jgi:hypothetical protein